MAKYNLKDLRNVLERSSARETTVRVACGAIARQFLAEFGIKVAGRVIRIGEIEAPYKDLPIDELIAVTEASSVRVTDAETEKKMEAYIDQIKQEGDSIGGIVECIVEGVPVGLGSHVQYDRKLDARIAQGVMSINAFKGVEIGIGFEAGTIRGSQVHDEILYTEERGYHRATNRLGGFEGGMTNGMPVVVRGVMKPIPTLYKPLQSVDIDTKEAFRLRLNVLMLVRFRQPALLWSMLLHGKWPRHSWRNSAGIPWRRYGQTLPATKHNWRITNMRQLTVQLEERSYPILIGSGLLAQAPQYFEQYGLTKKSTYDYYR